MKRMREPLMRGPGWFWNRKIRIAVLILIFTVATPHQVRSRFFDRCCDSITAGLSWISDTLDGVIRPGLKCIFGIDQDLEKFQRTVVWPR